MPKRTPGNYGRKFRDKSGRLIRYVYRRGKRIGVQILQEARKPPTKDERRAYRRYVAWEVYTKQMKR